MCVGVRVCGKGGHEHACALTGARARRQQLQVACALRSLANWEHLGYGGAVELAAVKLAAEELDAKDAEDDVEEQAHHKHVEHAGDRSQQA